MLRLNAIKRKFYLIIPVVCVIFLVSCAEEEITVEHWPEVIHSEEYAVLAENSLKEYHRQGRRYFIYLPEGLYSPEVDYMNWSIEKNYSSLPMDEEGVPLSVYNGEPQYNPCSHAQYCLTLHGQYVRTGSVAILEKFLTQLDVFLSRMEEDGSHRYNFAYPYYVDPENLFEPGWVSAMVNGHVLSLCARAYQLTEDEKYFEFAERALKFLQTPIEDGGVMTTLSALDPSLSGYTIWEEYPAIPATYTLNGFEFTLIGVYDWSCIKSPTQKLAKEMFDDGVRTLEKILPYYDIGGFTAYDLSHITWNRVVPHIGVGYHSEHTAFCKIFYDITGIETFNEYYQLWASYAE